MPRIQCPRIQPAYPTELKTSDDFQLKVSPEGKAVLEEHGWDKGFVIYGANLSEATVKLWTAAKLLTSRPKDFNFPYDSFTSVGMSFDEKTYTGTPPAKEIAIWGPEWRAISGSGPMPGFTFDGDFYMDTKKMLLAFDDTYKDSTLTKAEQAKVTELVVLNYKYQDCAMEMVLHYGGWRFHQYMQDMPKDRFEIALDRYGPDQKTDEWRKQKIAILSEFFDKLEAYVDDKALETGCWVGGKTTLADCALANWMCSLYQIANFSTMAEKFPTLWDFYQKQVELATPDGAKDHHEGFATFGKIIHAVNVVSGDRKGLFSCSAYGKHDINAPFLWEGKDE